MKNSKISQFLNATKEKRALFIYCIDKCMRAIAHQVSPDVFPISLYRDIASAIKELLDTVNNVIKKYQYQNRRVSHKHTSHRHFFHSLSLSFLHLLFFFGKSKKPLLCVRAGSGAPEKGVCEVLQKFQRHPENILQRRKVSATVDAAPQLRFKKPTSIHFPAERLRGEKQTK